MSDRSHILVKTRDEPLFAALGLILAAKRLIDLEEAPDVHQRMVALIEALRTELAKAPTSKTGG